MSQHSPLATVHSLPSSTPPPTPALSTGTGTVTVTNPAKQIPNPVTTTQGALALRYQNDPDLHAMPVPPVLRLVPAVPSLPDAQAWGTRLAQAVAEVLAGDRPIVQLIRFTDAVVFTDLNRRVRVLGLTTTATARGAKERSAVRSVRVFSPGNEVAEVSAHVRYGERSRAMALRLEVHRGRWICTALELD